MSEVFERIKLVRKLNQLNQSDFSKIIGISQAHLSNIESGKDNPSYKILRSICIELNLNFDWLKDGTGEMNNSSSLATEQKVILKIKKISSKSDDINWAFFLDFLNDALDLLDNTEERKHMSGDILVRIYFLFDNIIKLNKHLSEETLKITKSGNIKGKIDEVSFIRDAYEQKILTNIDELYNLYIGSGE